MASVADRIYLRRRIVNGISLVLSGAATLFGLFWLVWILWTTVSKGIDAFGLHLFTQPTPPPGEVSGGLANALFGSLVMSLLAVLMATPIGILAGTYLAEYANHRKIGETIRFINDILLSAPSIVLGLFVYTLIVEPLGGFSGWSGAVALGFIVLPVVVRTTDEMLRLVPGTMREAALSLGIPQWKVNVQVLYRAALPGIVTGVLLALARISGETAPLLFTAFGSRFFPRGLDEPIASLTVQIYYYALSPYDEWHAQAWAATLVLMTLILGINVTVRFFTHKKF